MSLDKTESFSANTRLAEAIKQLAQQLVDSRLDRVNHATVRAEHVANHDRNMRYIAETWEIMRNDMDEMRKDMDEMRKDMDEMRKDMDEIQRNVDELTAKVADLKVGIDSLEDYERKRRRQYYNWPV